MRRHAPSIAFRGPPPPYAFGYGGGVWGRELSFRRGGKGGLNLMVEGELFGSGCSRTRRSRGCP